MEPIGLLLVCIAIVRVLLTSTGTYGLQSGLLRESAVSRSPGTPMGCLNAAIESNALILVCIGMVGILLTLTGTYSLRSDLQKGKYRLPLSRHTNKVPKRNNGVKCSALGVYCHGWCPVDAGNNSWPAIQLAQRMYLFPLSRHTNGVPDCHNGVDCSSPSVHCHGWSLAGVGKDSRLAICRSKKR